MFELFGHTADLGLRVRAASLEELLAEAARGLLRMLVATPDSVQLIESKRIEITADSLEHLLFDWLNELLYTFETTGLLLADFDISLAEMKLSANCRGEPVDRRRHMLEHEVKAITYHNLRVEQDGTDWVAEVIVDV